MFKHAYALILALLSESISYQPGFIGRIGIRNRHDETTNGRISFIPLRKVGHFILRRGCTGGTALRTAHGLFNTRTLSAILQGVFTVGGQYMLAFRVNIMQSCCYCCSFCVAATGDDKEMEW